MCGLCGVLRFDGVQPDADLLARMQAPLAPRGPDDEGQHFDRNLALGHRRLSILDLSPRGHQPMRDDETGVAIVFNGTIYNFPCLLYTSPSPRDGLLSRMPSSA